MSFELYPAIDLKDGQCVRLLRGEMDQATQYNPDPGDQAAQFKTDGFQNLHVVDLNGAFEGESANSSDGPSKRSSLRLTCRSSSAAVFVARAHIDAWLEAGIVTRHPGDGGFARS